MFMILRNEILDAREYLDLSLFKTTKNCIHQKNFY